MADKFSSVWVSHSSMGDFLKCPRLYYLNNVYKDSKTGHKISLMQPPLALGQAVHEVVESLSVLPTANRFEVPLSQKFEEAWKKVEGKKGGFYDDRTERMYKDRGLDMLTRIKNNPGPIANKAVKIKMDLPHYWLSEDDGIILCGKIDWLEYLEASDSVHIIDFKTGKNEEDKDSLQLPIYLLLVKNCQNREVEKASYWYLGKSDRLTEVELPNEDEAYEKVMKVAKRVKLARQFEKYDCSQGESGCRYCSPLEKIVAGEGELVAVSEYNQDIYILPRKERSLPEAEIL